MNQAISDICVLVMLLSAIVLLGSILAGTRERRR